MRDMMSGFQGTFKQTKTDVVITLLEGPAGKLKKPEVLHFLVSKDTLTLTEQGPKNTYRAIFRRISAKSPKLPY